MTETAQGVGCQIDRSAIIGERCVLGDRVVVGPRATVLAPPQSVLTIRNDAEIGPAAVVSGATTIGSGARVEAGAVVTQDVPPHAIVAGNPAKVVGYSSSAASDQTSSPSGPIEPPSESGTTELLGGVSLIRFPEFADLRGGLTFGQLGGLLPFEVKRFFIVYDVPSESIRGEHAHRRIHQLLICTAGRVRVTLTDGVERRDVVLDHPSIGLHLPPMIWATQFGHSPATRLLVLCSDVYDAAEYIRDFDEFEAISR